MTQPRSGMPSGNRYGRAYPGIPYEVPIVVTGGCLPFAFSVANAPAGMTVATYLQQSDNGTWGSYGVISWPNPTTTATNVDVKATDFCGTTLTTTLASIAVSTSGFKFLDSTLGVAAASNGCGAGCGTGAIDAPWLTINDAVENASANDILVFRRRGKAAPYDYAGVPTGGSCSYPSVASIRFDINASTKWSAMIADPRDTGEAVIDMGWLGVWDASCATTVYQRMTGPNSWVEGITFYRFHSKAIEFIHTADYSGGVFWRNRCDTYGPGVDGQNSACLMTASTGVGTPFRYGGAIVGNVSIDQTSTDFIKTYTETYLVVVGNSVDQSGGELAIKGTHGYVEVADNHITGANGRVGIGGNVAGIEDYLVRYNLVRVTGTRTNGTASVAFHIGEGPGTIQQVDVYRNTFVGRMQHWTAVTWTGPISYTRNVIINGDAAQALPYFCGGNPTGGGEWGTCPEGSPLPTPTLTNNLFGSASDSILDGDGKLQGAYRTSYGPDSADKRGHEIGALADTPLTPRRLRFRLAEHVPSVDPFASRLTRLLR